MEDHKNTENMADLAVLATKIAEKTEIGTSSSIGVIRWKAPPRVLVTICLGCQNQGVHARGWMLAPILAADDPLGLARFPRLVARTFGRSGLIVT